MWKQNKEILKDTSITFVKERVRSVRLTDKYEFLNKFQVLKHYAGDKAMAKKVMNKCKRTRNNPNAPGNKKYKEYWVLTATLES